MAQQTIRKFDRPRAKLNSLTMCYVASWTRPHTGALPPGLWENHGDQLSSASQPLKVLLVEDSPHYVRLVYEAFRQINPAIQLHSVGDGIETMSFLRQEEPHANAPRPDIILLDLNLPKMDGREVLAQIKEDADLKTIPTVVLTTSDSDDDVKRSYQLHANSYLRKPLKWDDFVRLVISLNNFWLNTSVLPRH